MIRKNRGFTLLELMAVVIIVAVLSVVAVVSYKKYQTKARLMKGYALINELRIKEEAYYSTYSQYVSASNSLTDFYPDISGGVSYKTPGTAWGVDCSNTGGDVHAEGYCALGFSPGAYTNWYFSVVGWHPGVSSTLAANCVNNTNKPWWVIRTITAGSLGNGTNDQVTDAYELRTTSEVNNVYQRYCKQSSNCTRPNCGP